MTCLEEGIRRNQCLSEKNMAARFKFVKFHLRKPEDFWNLVLERLMIRACLTATGPAIILSKKCETPERSHRS